MCSSDLDVYKSVIIDMGVNGVRASIGQEIYSIYINNTGGQLIDGLPLSLTGTLSGILPEVKISSNDSIVDVLTFIGINTSITEDGAIGFATIKGRVQNVDTSLLSIGFIYLGLAGAFTQARPLYPSNRLLIGGTEKIDVSNGIINVGPRVLPRNDVGKS